MTRPPQIERGIVVRWALTALLALAVCIGPLWLWGVPLRWYRLKLDDFVYLAESRALPALGHHLAAPHNGHVVPLFRFETHLLARLAGSLEALPRVLGAASYVTLVLAVAAVGHLVAWETARPARGIAAMAALGFSSVLGPAVLWYAASQALAAGTVILGMLAALQAWRARGSWWLLALAALAALAAPLFWSGGYTAGLVGLAYLWADGRRSCRIAAALPLAASAVVATLVWGVAGRAIGTATHLTARSFRDVWALPTVLAHTAQAVWEALVLNNFGLEGETTAGQAIVLCSLLAGIWVWSRRRRATPREGPWFRASPLEAAGAVLVIANFGLVFAVRGTETTFDNLRALGWYDAIPQLGAVLFAAGWWSGRLESSPATSIQPPRIRELLGVVLFGTLVLVFQTPRADRVIFAYDGLSAEIRDPRDSRSQRRTGALLAEQARLQRRSLAELDRVEQTARERGTGRAALRPALGRAVVPGMPETLPDFSALDLLDIPDPQSPELDSSHGDISKKHGRSIILNSHQ